MIQRIVKLKFEPEYVETFLAIFRESREKILAFDGCVHVELWHDTADPCSFATFSKWESEDDLNAYRNSELFKDVWARTKAGFSEKAQAWSFEVG